MNKKSAFIVVAQLPKNTVNEMVSNVINVMLVRSVLQEDLTPHHQNYGSFILRGNKRIIN
jgi:hypothetical protein